ncbi:MAG: thioredoxin family protein [Acidobacteriota bacterium]
MPFTTQRPTLAGRAKHFAGLAAAALLASPVAAQAPADAVFKDFQPSGEFEIKLDGQVLESAELFHAERAASYLILAPELSSPLLINARTRTVEQVSFMKVAKRPAGTIDLLADAGFQTVGPFTIGSQHLSFNFKGQKIDLVQKPPLTGIHPPSKLISHNPAYGFKAKQYEPNAGHLSTLKAVKKDVTVRVYFGNWCPVCSRLVPKVIKVEEALAGASKVTFEYYGLPRTPSDDPVAVENKVSGVPTAIITIDGKEKGRLNGRDLYSPEASLGKLLAGS